MRSLKRFPPRPILLTITALLAAGAFAGSLRASRSHPSPKDKGEANSASGIAVPDKGKYQILLDGKEVGQEDFSISSSGNVWTARGSTTMQIPGASNATATGTLKFTPDGTPIHYEWSTQTQKKVSGAVEFMGGTAKTTADLGGASPYAQDFVFMTPRIAILDNNLYDQYAVLTRLYDWKSGGKQSFPVLIPQAVTPGSIDIESLGQQQVEGTMYDAVRVTSPDLEIMLYFDSDRRLMRLEVPASKVIIRRQ